MSFINEISADMFVNSLDINKTSSKLKTLHLSRFLLHNSFWIPYSYKKQKKIGLSKWKALLSNACRVHFKRMVPCQVGHDPFPLLTSALVPVRNGVKLCSLGELNVMPGSGVCVFTQLGKKISVKNGKKVVFVFCNHSWSSLPEDPRPGPGTSLNPAVGRFAGLLWPPLDHPTEKAREGVGPNPKVWEIG